jgi:RNA polymerase sigma-70 factor (ECF subfamily)
VNVERVPHKSDAELVANMLADDADALETLIRRYARLVYRVAADILRDAAEAEDITQEVFLEIYRKAHQYDPSRGTVKVWLLQYAYHPTLRRKASLRRRVAYCGEPLDEIERHHAAYTRTDHRFRLDASADGRPGLFTREECRWLIWAGLEQLPDRQRQTLELVCLEDLTLRDVAERLRVSLGCARHYYYRGLSRMRDWAQSAVNPRTLPLAPPAPSQKEARDA